MSNVKASAVAPMLNVGLRMATLVTKLALMLYMGRYLSLADMGAYGLVFGVVMIATALLGVRLDYVVSRDLVGSTPLEALCKMRDQAVFYFFNYVVLFVILIPAIVINWGNPGNERAIFYIFTLSVVESYAGVVHSNVVSLGRPLLANVLFFIRAALWVFAVVGIGVAVPSLRTVDMILACWLAGALLSLAVALALWWRMPWAAMLRTAIDWKWIRNGIRKCFFIWLGTLGVTAGYYIDRFIVMHFLGLDYVGISTFYISFTSALHTLILSGVLSFSYPRLIVLHRDNDQAGFIREAKQTGWYVAVFSAVIAIGIGVGVPMLGYLFKRPELARETPTLIWLLAGTWMRSNAETLYYILFARHEDRAIWLGNLLFLLPAFGCPALFVYFFGFIGIGYGSLVSSSFLLMWRWRYVRSSGKKNHESNSAHENNC